VSTRREQSFAAGVAVLFAFAVFFLYSTPAEDQTKYESVLVHTACAPWDGAAVEIEFYTSPARCGQNVASTLRIALWGTFSPPVGQEIRLGRDPKLGAATYCPQENKCEAARSGSIFIETYERGKGATGHYEFVFPKAGRRTGNFRAVWCETREMCG
jgi:hypothetical protein